MKRRSFLLGSAAGLAAVLAGCTPQPPTPTRSPTPVPTSPPPGPPVALRRSNWGGDPFFRGAFSFPGVASTPRDREVLATPVGERLFFAGEATSVDAPGTVHGALETGRRVAQQVLEVAGEHERIVVVGAGVAGILAAGLLGQAGHRVIVAEASDRIGGRIRTETPDDWPMPLELGAAFLGPDAGLLTPMLDQLGIPSEPFRPVPEYRAPSGAVLAADDTGVRALRAAVDWADGVAIDLSVETALDRSGAGEAAAATPDGAAWLDHALDAGLGILTGAPATRISAHQAGHYLPALETEPSGMRRVTGSFAEFLADAAAELDVLTGAVVQRVARDDDAVRLRLDTGESLAADRVVITVPLGVLKSDAFRFTPALPIAHAAAIARLGVGRLEVVWLRFDEHPAPLGHGDANVWTTVGGDDPFAAWIDYRALTGDPVLAGFVAAEHAEALADQDDASVVEAALASLATFVD